jgi:hypothetical protein
MMFEPYRDDGYSDLTKRDSLGLAAVASGESDGPPGGRNDHRLGSWRPSVHSNLSLSPGDRDGRGRCALARQCGGDGALRVHSTGMMLLQAAETETLRAA